ncbi:unnamed protein product [Vitrella brassicaformis CCMP3155]|uniref:Tubulin delta chain n=1 Tax=Vitrella brassicaformis (strain CCMP3155) TaxID=1169540 RepID=A0A0G4H6Z4_VITBC|nr:unnamed protein product [Vitrella brassicaformis CCMP3155]|eukprot:CEM39636.1 unnamed protein product [Vitrella brassicaformis CCMP3155]
MVKEVICVHLGQAGVQVGYDVWELFCAEHQIGCDGHALQSSVLPPGVDAPHESFFYETGSGQYVPRSVMFDLDPSAVDEVRNSRLKHLFHPESLVNFKQDSGGTFVQGQQMGRQCKQVPLLMDRVRLAVDLCDNFQGFFVFRSWGGGTGGGVGVDALEELGDAFCVESYKKIFEVVIYPSAEHGTTTVEPYNCVFSGALSRHLADLSYMLDNQAAYNMCRHKMKVSNPTFEDLNAVLAQVVSASTLSLRYDVELNSTLDEICTNIIPEPQFRYPIVSLAPVRSKKSAGHENFSPYEITKELFESKNLLCDAGPHFLQNRFEAACVVFRGEGDTGYGAVPVQACEVYDAIRRLKNPTSRAHIPKFCPWIKNLGFKVGIVGVPPVTTPNSPFVKTKRQAALLSNSTAVRNLFIRQYRKFLKLFYHKAFVHQYIAQGFTMDDFLEALEQYRDIIETYRIRLNQCKETEEEMQRQALGLTGPPPTDTAATATQ